MKRKIIKQLKILPECWQPFLKSDKIKKETRKIIEGLSDAEFYPGVNEIYRCMEIDIIDIKCVILGQDPYPGKGQAHGLSFSVRNDFEYLPGSLRRIFKCLENTVNFVSNGNTDLSPWFDQGIMLMNCAFTVVPKITNSHKKLWKKFTDLLIKYISTNGDDIIFMLWGNFAISKRNLIDETKHTVLTYKHPSPMNAGVWDCYHFKKFSEKYPDFVWSV